MAIVIFSLGSNLGNGQINLLQANELIAQLIGKITQASPLYETKPWGFTSEHLFTNQIILVETTLDPEVILARTQEIERILGRTEKSKNQSYTDRIIDIDIIDYNGQIITTENLQLPHHAMHRRQFVLEPLCAVYPNWIHPILHRTAQELLSAL